MQVGHSSERRKKLPKRMTARENFFIFGGRREKNLIRGSDEYLTNILYLIPLQLFFCSCKRRKMKGEPRKSPASSLWANTKRRKRFSDGRCPREMRIRKAVNRPLSGEQKIDGESSWNQILLDPWRSMLKLEASTTPCTGLQCHRQKEYFKYFILIFKYCI